MTRVFIASLILGTLAAAYPERLRGWIERWLRSFPLLYDRLLQFIELAFVNGSGALLLPRQGSSVMLLHINPRRRARETHRNLLPASGWYYAFLLPGNTRLA